MFLNVEQFKFELWIDDLVHIQNITFILSLAIKSIVHQSVNTPEDNAISFGTCKINVRDYMYI